MDVTSTLDWPDALTHGITAVPETGVFGIVTDIPMGANDGIDVLGYSAVLQVGEQKLTLYGAPTFDGLLLPDSVTPRVGVDTTGTGIDPISYSYSVFTGVDLNFTLNVFPTASASFAGEKITTTDGLTK